MTLTLAEQQLLLEALRMASSRCDTYARSGKKSAVNADKAERMLQLRLRFSTLRARHDILEMAS